jgi:hypothetical protein
MKILSRHTVGAVDEEAYIVTEAAGVARIGRELAAHHGILAVVVQVLCGAAEELGKATASEIVVEPFAVCVDVGGLGGDRARRNGDVGPLGEIVDDPLVEVDEVAMLQAHHIISAKRSACTDKQA